MKLTLSDISLTLQHKRILNHVSFTAPEGSFVSLLGESGAGKSTTLNVIAGLTLQDHGTVTFNDQPVDALPPHKRQVSMVFQDFRLFPHMNVLKNVAFPCRMQKLPHAEQVKRAREALAQVHLSDFEEAHVTTLSGGQAQRVALARALAAHPQLLLLDEPFSGLDEHLRDGMRSLVLSLHKSTHTTSIMVTHDAHEALMMSDQIVYMLKGRIAQQGTPEKLYYQPACIEVAQCFGACSTLKGFIHEDEFTCGDLCIPLSKTQFTPKSVPTTNDANTSDSRPARVVIRHQGVSFTPDFSDAFAHTQALPVRCGVFHGDCYHVRIDIDGQTLTVPASQLPKPDTEIQLYLDPRSVFVFED